jgi:hypothetical protein
MDKYTPKSYGPESEDKEYLSPLRLDPHRLLPGLPIRPDSDESSRSGVLLASGESNFYDSFQSNINPQVYPARSGINYEYPSGNFEDLRGFLEYYWDKTPISNIVDTYGATILVKDMTPKQLADFVFKNSGVFFTDHESQWSYSDPRESGLFTPGAAEGGRTVAEEVIPTGSSRGVRFYKYYRIAYTDTLNRRQFVDIREDITNLYSRYSSAANSDVTLEETQKEDFTLFNPYIHYSPYRDYPNSIAYQYVYINYLADYKVSTLNSNPYKF